MATRYSASKSVKINADSLEELRLNDGSEQLFLTAKEFTMLAKEQLFLHEDRG